MEQTSEFQCIVTVSPHQWLYQIGEEGIVYSQTQNRFAGLDAAGLLAYRAFDAGASLQDLLAFSAADQISPATTQALDAILALSRGRYAESRDQERRNWPPLASPPCANVEVHGIPILFECPHSALEVLGNDCFLSAPSTTRRARFHLRVQRAGTSWTIVANNQEIFPSLRDEQIGLGLLHTVRLLLYDDVQYDVAFHAAMVADDRHGIVLCAPRESGKSTLAACLIAHGFASVSDEPAFLRLHTASISPVEMPISAKESTWSLLEDEWPQLVHAPIHIRSDGRRIRLLHASQDRVAHAPRRLTHIIFPSYSPTSTSCLEALSPIRRLTLLNEGGMLLGKHLTKDKFEQFLRLICETPAYIARYGSLQEAEQMIQTILGS